MSPARARRGSLVAQIRAVGGIVIALVSTKGGSGKSTVAWNLAHEIAQRGARVLLLCTDPQRTLTDAAAVRTIPERVRVQHYPHLSLRRDFAHLRIGWDVVVIDALGRHDQLTRAVVATAAGDEYGVILVPVPPSPPDVWATRRDTGPVLREAAEAAEAVGRTLVVRMLLTQYDPRESITAATLEALTAADIAPLTEAWLTRRTVYSHAIGVGQAVCEYEPRGAAASEVAALATETIKLALAGH
ncbi:ParA family protein [Nocardia paucivorans]|uniref:ParA family protein n=1 Tax=Nocardia paucivorans TaxID=114259 RepID=UPI0002FD9E7C|nr:ParA family protein [Nocardia paucivorans]